jgi:hypothetical protein
VLRALVRFEGYSLLKALVWNVKEGWEPLKAAGSADRFDVALMLKLVPVLRRIEPESLEVLRAVPADFVLLSGAKTAMVKRQSIEARERGDIERFVQGCGWQIAAEAATNSEFFYLVRR